MCVKLRFSPQKIKSFEDASSYLSSRPTERALSGGRPAWDIWPAGPKRINALARQIKIEMGLSSSRTDVLVMGNTQRYTASRAGPILSLVGANRLVYVAS